MSSTSRCICNPSDEVSSQSSNIFKCTKCKDYFHISCYDTPTIQLLNNTIMCIECKLEIIEPFWQIKSFLQKPVLLPSNTDISLSYDLNLESEILNSLEKDEMRLIIFCTRVKASVLSNFVYEWPSENFHLYFNGKEIVYKQFSYAFLESKNSIFPKNNLKIICKEAITTKSVYGIALVQKIEIKEIAKNVAKGNKFNMDEAKKRYLSLKEDDMELNIGIPIKDPMTSYVLYLPTRGINCEHLSCFDLMSYLEFNRTNYSNMRWKCPICRFILNSHELIIDLYLHRIIKDIKNKLIQENGNDHKISQFTHIFLNEKGEWVPKDNFLNFWNEQNKIKETHIVISENKESKKSEENKVIQSKIPIESILKPNLIVINDEKPEKSTEMEIEEIKLSFQPKNDFNQYPIEENQSKPESMNIETHETQEIQQTKIFVEPILNNLELSIQLFLTNIKNIIDDKEKVLIFQDKDFFLNLNNQEFYQFLVKTNILNLVNKKKQWILNKKEEKQNNITVLGSELYEKSELGILCDLLIIWGKSINELIAISALIINQNFTNNNDFMLAMELFVVLSYRVNTTNFEKFNKLNSQYKYFGLLLNLLFVKMNCDIKFFAQVLLLLSRLFENLFFSKNLKTKIEFENLVDFMNKYVKHLSFKEFIEFFCNLHQAPQNEILIKEEEQKTKNFLFYFNLIMIKKQLNIKSEQISRIILEKFDLNGKIKSFLIRERLEISDIQL